MTRDCRCDDLGNTCHACEQAIAQREAARYDVEVEPLDRWGRDADWHYPRDLAPRGL